MRAILAEPTKAEKIGHFGFAGQKSVCGLLINPQVVNQSLKIKQKEGGNFFKSLYRVLKKFELCSFVFLWLPAVAINNSFKFPWGPSL